MRLRKSVTVLFVPLFAATLWAQTAIQIQTSTSAPKPAKVRFPNYVDPTLLDLTLVLPLPPPQNSATTKSELAEVHRVEQGRTPEQVAAAEYDDHHEDIFLYSKVLGPNYTADALPLTALLSARIRNDAGLLNSPLKTYFQRPRPYNFDTSLHPICDTNKDFSYPSGHALNGYLFGFVLLQMVPEKHSEVLVRADEYGENRVVCEAHYPSDLEASRRVAYAILAAMLSNPRFQDDLTAARTELRQHLKLPPITPAP
jgi:acid phosphatase (class A)